MSVNTDTAAASVAVACGVLETFPPASGLGNAIPVGIGLWTIGARESSCQQARELPYGRCLDTHFHPLGGELYFENRHPIPWVLTVSYETVVYDWMNLQRRLHHFQPASRACRRKFACIGMEAWKVRKLAINATNGEIENLKMQNREIKFTIIYLKSSKFIRIWT